ncbi:MAG: hypothetical protein J0M04_20975 [Verrucomicrobia bacterium]|nr:hypothetical protein [Verrucomicrobiota bacterium]
MPAQLPKKTTKTFPLDIDENLHKALKISAISEGKTLHSLIIDTLSAKVHEQTGEYKVNTRKGGVR